MITITINTETAEIADSLLSDYDYEYFTRRISYDTGETETLEGYESPILALYDGFFTKIILTQGVAEAGFLSDYWVTSETSPSLSDLKWSVSGIADYNE